ncbi:MAG: DUF3488 and transglutaminase-like domain-containing protein [Azoarcus sp.]|jgi:transglutaminase-like putative cysteine protease|nr:DUF3488 and transglutaminase-like domain-containing protein [Azoarcus sp.]
MKLALPITLAEPPSVALRRDQGFWLLVAVVLTLLPHLPDLPLWAGGLCALLVFWRGLRLWRGQDAPPRWLLLPLVFATAIGVRLTFGQLFGKTPGLVFLAVLLALKLLETRNMRDIRVVVLLCFFLQFGLFFNHQSLPFALLALLATLFSFGGQIALVDPASNGRERLRTGALLLAQGLPFMLVFFLLFPRAAMPLWGVPDDATAMTGLSDSMSPGTISEMILSDELAFTVEFTGARPPPRDRYWRGPVLSHFDGDSWRTAFRPTLDAPEYAPSGRRFDYRMTLEPNNQRWLPLLDYPAGGAPGVRFGHDFQAVTRHPVVSRTQYLFSAFPDTPVGVDELHWVLKQARQLPTYGNPKARALAAELQTDSAERTVGRIVDWLAAGDFAYTLKPPLMAEDGIDFFLFKSRKGFCEHFSAAFVFLARAAGVPARVVTGYQGGRVNPVSGLMTVRQSDAHAWAEVWFEGRGWTRVDPTALAAPQRIENGLEGAVSEGLPFMLRPQYAWLRGLRDQWEAVATRWDNAVVAYDGRRQRDLFESFGIDDFSPSPVLGALAIATALLMAVFYLWAQRRRDGGDELDRAWARFSARLGRMGLARAPAEGPLDYARRLAAARPREAEALTFICTRYARLRYRPPWSRDELSDLERALDALELKKEATLPP